MTNNTVAQTLERINRDTQWNSLSQDQVSSALIRMEDATVNFYESETWNRKEHSAIQEFWDREWGCTYDWKKHEWRYIASGKRFESEGEKRAKRVWEERIDDGEQEQEQQEQQEQLSWSGVDWLSAYDSYHDYGWYDKMTEQKQVTTATTTTATATATATAPTTTKCQTVLYIEELSHDSIPDWRMFIHYNHNSNRYIINGTRGNGHAGGLRGAPLPEIRLAFQYRSDVLDYLAWCMNSRPACNMAMYAMCCESVATLRVDELLSSRSKKTELYGYNDIQLRTADLREQLAVLRGLDSTYSNFDDITLV
jgi:hypothetical protein